MALIRKRPKRTKLVRKQPTAHINTKLGDNTFDTQEQEGELKFSSNAGIDKVDFFLYEHISLSRIKENADRINAECKLVRLPGNKGYVYQVIGELNQKVSFFLYNSSVKSSRKVLSNPSKNFTNYISYRDFLIALIGRNQFECASIYRVDLFVDIHESFDEIKKYVFCPRKNNEGLYE